MASKLPSRPHLDQLRSQAKTLLDQLESGDANAAQVFIDFLPDARRMTRAQAKRAGFRLADAQSAVARQTGFASWPSLARHVQQLRSRRVPGAAMPSSSFDASHPNGPRASPAALARRRLRPPRQPQPPSIHSRLATA